jgi:adenylate kinase
MKLIFLGPPGAGKGTLAALVCKEYGIPHISTGDLFRDAISRETRLGLEVKDIVEKGGLVPDRITVDIVRERLAQTDAQMGYVLDGFPRTIQQAVALEQFESIDAVVRLVIKDEIVIRRLSGREICKSCGAIYNINDSPSKVEGVCNNCGGGLYTRPDDSPESIENRLKVYKNQTEPLVQFYISRNLLFNIDSSISPDYSLAQINNIFDRPEL